MERTLNDIVREAEENACTCATQCPTCDADVCDNCEHYIPANFVDNFMDAHREEA